MAALGSGAYDVNGSRQQHHLSAKRNATGTCSMLSALRVRNTLKKSANEQMLVLKESISGYRHVDWSEG